MKPDFRFYTAEQAAEKGLDCDPPTRTACKHCGAILEDLGIASSKGMVHWVAIEPCECEGAQAERRQAEEAERMEVRKEERELMLERMKRAGIARRFTDSKVHMPQSVAYIKDFAKAQGRGLYLFGRGGSGKTSESCAIARTFLQSGYAVVFTTTLAMLDAVSKSYEKDGTAGISRFCDADLLVLDDLGKENANSWAATTLFQVINSRYESLLPTILTSQYPPERLEGRLARNGERESAQAIASRIWEMCEVVRMPDVDYRRRRADSDLQTT